MRKLRIDIARANENVCAAVGTTNWSRAFRHKIEVTFAY